MLHRLSDTKAWMLAVLRCHAYSIDQMQILHSRPPSHGHECDFILVRSGSFQKAGRSEVAFTQEYRNKPIEPVQNRFKIRMVRKSEPEIGPARKRTIPFPYEQKRQVQFRSTFRTCWVSTGTRKCISLTVSPSMLEKLSFPAEVPVFFFILFLDTSF